MDLPQVTGLKCNRHVSRSIAFNLVRFRFDMFSVLPLICISVDAVFGIIWEGAMVRLELSGVQCL